MRHTVRLNQTQIRTGLLLQREICVVSDWVAVNQERPDASSHE